MTRYMLSIIVLAVALGAAGQTSPRGADWPVNVFKDLDGEWNGTFVGYAADGKELYRIQVTQRYRTVSDSTQMVEITDRMPDGTTITGKGQNVATRNADGSMRLSCTVKKTNGDRVQHAGRVVMGPDETEHIIWHSSAPNRTETFREHVHRDAAGQLIYEINGMGRYDGTMILMHGRYVKQAGDVPTTPGLPTRSR